CGAPPRRGPAGAPPRRRAGSPAPPAARGASPVVVTGEAGREALAVALRIVSDIERALPSLQGGVSLPARA
ncbi:MAG: hypothetical protein LH467_09840, partial [Gemmatimonadaceae bacterium]|nr:hypothetical protein [Gemmatimonadaceae bacterium]